MRKSYAEQNEFGFWVGCNSFESGVSARVTNAYTTKEMAEEKAAIMLDARKRTDVRKAMFTPCYH